MQGLAWITLPVLFYCFASSLHALLNGYSALAYRPEIDETSTVGTSPGRKAAAMGLYMVMLGFFLPWIKPVKSDFLKGLLSEFPEASRLRYTWVAGSDFTMGWVILSLSALSVVVYRVIPAKLADTSYALELIGIATAAFLLFYVVLSTFSSIQFGLLLVVFGVWVQARGLAADR